MQNEKKSHFFATFFSVYDKMIESICINLFFFLISNSMVVILEKQENLKAFNCLTLNPLTSVSNTMYKIHIDYTNKLLWSLTNIIK